MLFIDEILSNYLPGCVSPSLGKPIELSMESKARNQDKQPLFLLRPLIRCKGLERQGMQIAGSHSGIHATVNQLMLLH